MAYDEDEAIADKILKSVTKFAKELQDATKGMEDVDKKNAEIIKRYTEMITTLYTSTKRMEEFANKQKEATKAMHEQKEAQTAETIRRQQHYFDEERSLTDYRHSFEDFDNMLNNIVNAFTGKLSIVGAFKGIATTADRINKAHDKMETVMGRATSRFQELWQGGMREEEDFRADPAMDHYIRTAEEIQNTLAGLLEGQKIGNQTIGDRLEGAKEYFKKHAVGIALSIGAAAVIFAVLKKALDVSPMFQQMLKLLNYGIMMILRPIGDFFGFLMRPILIMLLRKFIIPWYSNMYPKMLKWGTDVGNSLAAILSILALLTPDKVEASSDPLKDIFEGNPLISLSDGDKTLFGLLGITPENFVGGWEKMIQDIENFDLLGKLAGLLNPFPDAAGEDGFGGMITNWFQDGLDKAYANFSSFYFVGIKWFKDGLKDAEVTWSKFWDGIKTWWDDGLETIENTNFTDIWTGIKDWWDKGLADISSPFQYIWDAIVAKIVGGGNPNTDTDEGWDPIQAIKDALGMAGGGQINEPIFGIGKSGRTYKFGERGSETVIPHGGAMGNITINIENMSGSQQDLNNLRQTILDVVQEANTRRGRI